MRKTPAMWSRLTLIAFTAALALPAGCTNYVQDRLALMEEPLPPDRLARRANAGFPNINEMPAPPAEKPLTPEERAKARADLSAIGARAESRAKPMSSPAADAAVAADLRRQAARHGAQALKTIEEKCRVEGGSPQPPAPECSQ